MNNGQPTRNGVLIGLPQVNGTKPEFDASASDFLAGVKTGNNSRMPSLDRSGVNNEGGLPSLSNRGAGLKNIFGQPIEHHQTQVHEASGRRNKGGAQRDKDHGGVAHSSSFNGRAANSYNEIHNKILQQQQ